MINCSFGANILLVIIKIIGLILSNALAMVAATMDSALDVCTGFVLYITIMMGKKGI